MQLQKKNMGHKHLLMFGYTVFSVFLGIVIGQVVNGFKLKVDLDELLGRNSLLSKW